MKAKEIKVNYHVLGSSLVINYSGKTFPFSKDLPIAQKILDLIRSGKKNEIPELIDYSLKLSKVDATKEFLVIDGKVYSNGVEVDPYMSNRLMELSELGLPIEPLLNFWKKVQLNPSETSRAAVFKFVEFNKFPLTDDGNFIAYKRVRKDLKDIHSGTFDNSPGKQPTMDWKDVDPNPNNTCSRGLHVAGYDYAMFSYGGGRNSGNIMIEVEVNPKDVVAVPTDYNAQKCRVATYLVVSISDGEIQDDLIDIEKLKAYGEQQRDKIISMSNSPVETIEDDDDLIDDEETVEEDAVTVIPDPVKVRDDREKPKEMSVESVAEIGKTLYEVRKISS